MDVGEHLTDEFKQISRFQKVPVIDDKGFTLTERYSQTNCLSCLHLMHRHVLVLQSCAIWSSRGISKTTGIRAI